MFLVSVPTDGMSWKPATRSTGSYQVSSVTASVTLHINPFSLTLFQIVAKMSLPKCSATYWSNPHFLFFDIRALWHAGPVWPWTLWSVTIWHHWAERVKKAMSTPKWTTTAAKHESYFHILSPQTQNRNPDIIYTLLQKAHQTFSAMLDFPTSERRGLSCGIKLISTLLMTYNNSHQSAHSNDADDNDDNQQSAISILSAFAIFPPMLKQQKLQKLTSLLAAHYQNMTFCCFCFERHANWRYKVSETNKFFNNNKVYVPPCLA